MFHLGQEPALSTLSAVVVVVLGAVDVLDVVRDHLPVLASFQYRQLPENVITLNFKGRLKDETPTQ